MGRCPLCDIEMREVSAHANPGQIIILDQCSKCGGIWCDKWELYPVDPEEASRLDPLDQKLLQTPVLMEEKPLYCPRCRVPLQVFHDPLLPHEIHLQRCPRCDGIWLNRGQFSLYKQFQKKTREEKLDHEEVIQRVTQAYQDPKFWVTTGVRGIYAYPHPQVEADDWGSKVLSGGFWLILRILLRLVLSL
jgi:Zn-finger nucleic acid-binding protein